MGGRSSRDEQGMTLIEVLVAMSLLGVVSALVIVGVQNAVRVVSHTDDENRGLQDAKVILDRLSRDIRQARGVVCDDAAAANGDPIVDAQRAAGALPRSCAAMDRRRLRLPAGFRRGRDVAAVGQPGQRPLRRLEMQGCTDRRRSV